MAQDDLSRSDLYARRTRNFYKLLPGAVTYPLQGEGKFTVPLLAGLLWIGAIVAWLLPWLLGWLAGLLFLGFLCAYLIKVVGSSAQGGEELPGLPAVADIVSDAFYPLFLLGGAVLFCQFPAIALYLGWGYGEWQVSPYLIGVVSNIGLVYLPMSLISVSLYESASALHPLLVVRWIIRVPIQYLVTCVVLLCVLGATEYLALHLLVSAPILRSFLLSTLNLYALLVSMRILGLLYYANEGKLAWK
jgi:hypothetical protein